MRRSEHNPLQKLCYQYRKEYKELFFRDAQLRALFNIAFPLVEDEMIREKPHNEKLREALRELKVTAQIFDSYA